MTNPLPRRFHLQRDTDVSGVSGTGRVANGVLWPDGAVSLRWIGARPSVVFWDRLEDAEAVHGHGGATRIVWDDEPTSPAYNRLKAAAKDATEAAHLHAMQAVKRVYELCREHDARSGLIPANEVLNALGLNDDGAQP
ncbi:hypothetical protein [Streptomyces scabiei]|uniref:hypothetical protein n=1 Tax=Streptomyces scabiei TaxID=1930 RepID=UPI000B30782B|nr:hypothetical protein [Streptomyces scabiei]